MQKIKYCIWLAPLLALVLFTLTCRADETKADKPKPYPLKTRLVCGMKLGEMGQPYVFVYKGQEIKVCDPSEKKDFDQDPDKYMKKLADEAAKLKK